MTHDEAIAELKLFVIHEWDGSIAANHQLDKLLWEVRKSHPHNHARTEPAELVSTEVEIDLEELGL